MPLRWAVINYYHTCGYDFFGSCVLKAPTASVPPVSSDATSCHLINMWVDSWLKCGWESVFSWSICWRSQFYVQRDRPAPENWLPLLMDTWLICSFTLSQHINHSVTASSCWHVCQMSVILMWYCLEGKFHQDKEESKQNKQLIDKVNSLNPGVSVVHAVWSSGWG